LAPSERHRLNLEGTEKIIELAAKHRVGKLVVTSHAAVYGALADNPYFMTEAHPPSVGRSFPEMQDLVTADLLTAAAMWKHPDIEMVVLRPVHAVGPTSRGVLAQLLRRRRVPMVLGYDPMVQVIHEDDLPEAFACALFSGVRGVFNVAGPGEVPLSVLVRESGGEPLAIPEMLLNLARGRFGVPDVPGGAVDFLKHPSLVDGSAFCEATGYAPAHDLRSTLRAMRAHVGAASSAA
jgi:UDP-glucose 4-epimerase